MENGKNRLQQTQDDVEEVKVIMLDNLNKAEEKSEKLHELEDRADELHSKAKVFELAAEKVKQKYTKKRCEGQKMKWVFIGIGVVVGLIILGLIIRAIV
ncbi:vesicle-associated membrane protein 3-like isoform X2 [Anoplopoma fimbria]|uniref:vesicle-associated membrane protein 3-like isoform X2 n=1 Tax=Anoplopoma fimbria TaxID=229290 RepID=UPI0023EB0B77|nr:vesicle-associated membrane protein 3-like isoform X2 [Anoplopoma fimbria]